MATVGETGSKRREVESDREGSDNHEEEPIFALERFPDPVWCKILSFLEAPKDFINVSRTCWDLNDIVERDRLTWVPPIRMVLPFVSHYLSKVDILTLRQVSSRFCSDMDRFLDAHPYRKFYSDANYTAPENLSILGTTLHCERYCHPVIAEIFGASVEGHCREHGNRNPFVGRTLHLKLNGRLGAKTSNRFLKNVMYKLFLYPSIQNHYWHVKITGDHLFENVWSLWLLFGKIFASLRNIRSVLVDLPAGCYLEKSGKSEFMKNVKNAQLPELRHSGPLLVEFTQKNPALSLLNLNITNRFHSQLTKIDMDLNEMKLFKYQCPHLKTLTLSGMTFHDVVCLERFEAPLLEHLTMDWQKSPKSSIFEGQVNVLYLGIILSRFKHLRVLKLSSMGPDIQLCSCIWDMENNSCFAIPNCGIWDKDVKNHDRDQHESIIWMLIRQSVKEFYLNNAKFVRPRPNLNFSVGLL